MSLLVNNIQVEGLSIAGLETCVWLPRLKLAFDFGRTPQRMVHVPCVALTHGHLDHVGGLPAYVAARALGGLPPPRIVLPPPLLAPCRALLALHEQMGECSLPAELLPLQVGQELALSPQLRLRAFGTSHRVASQGYCVYVVKKKLLPALQGLPAHEIAARVRAGEAVHREHLCPEVAFTGDTTIEWLQGAREGGGGGVVADALRARLLITECTYLDDRAPPSKAQAVGHTHLNDLCAAAHHFRNEAVLLTHFSARFKAEEIVAALDEKLPPDLRLRVTPLLAGFRSDAAAGASPPCLQAPPASSPAAVRD